HVDAAADDRAALTHRLERGGDERADRGEDDRRVELVGRRLARVASPRCPKLPRERLPLVVAGASEGINFPSLAHRDLSERVRRAAEAINPKPLSIAGPHDRTVATA